MTTNQTIYGLWRRINALFLPSTASTDQYEFKKNTLHFSGENCVEIRLQPGQSLWVGGEKHTRTLISEQRIKEVNERFLRERGYEQPND